jgi:hypothetical protein
MIYDDDTGKRVHLEIGLENRPPEPGTVPEQPSNRVRELIIDHANRHEKWGPDRLHAHFRHIHKRHDVTLGVIRNVLTQKEAERRR